MSTQPNPTETPAQLAKANKPSRLRRNVLMLLVPCLLIAGGLYAWITGGRYEETENANMRLARITIASEIAGRVVSVNVAENVFVKKGDVLFQVDPQPLKIALDQADAAVESARLQVIELKAGYSQALTQEQIAADDAAFYQDTFDRQKALTAKGVATNSSLDDARHTAQKAAQGLVAAKQAVATAQAALADSLDGAIDDHPLVVAAKAARNKAAYNLSVATVRAPADGLVYQASSFRAGEYVTPGASLFTIVETTDPWIDANFKEPQLAHMKPDQPAKVVFDLYPNRTFKAKVDSIGAGTGAEFSLLPAQNATGNWVKVTQRIPVRIKLDNSEARILARSGLSATVTVDTGASRSFGDLFSSARASE
ncbi:HlyD family secretion protein [Hoeflea alexandrii]|uniref:HlyD family efflux transporter periplasmic adaptor subunit n=1 Tax=Hoeflea alexandrii TaxID=288436 RepID=A0ABT1CUE6_9HYPH|nr:HlyD family secretion protein [Hoeflea alexandrii]MCO6409538.1 HlyD family efflux transporter periplasmic adaptor subunit [Hoeflea alexandrii]